MNNVKEIEMPTTEIVIKIHESADTELEHKCAGETPPNPLSKRQLKKREKLAKYEKLRKQRRIKEHEREKEKRKAAVALGLPARTGPSRKELKKRQIAVNDDSASIRVAIDLDFDDLMHERDIAKCVKQCLRMYTINRRSEKPGVLHFTGIKRDGRIHKSFKRNDGWENWHIRYHFDETHIDAFESDELVYLTCESDEILNEIKPEVVYVIGGLVDHNHQKGLCHSRATASGLKTARLPLSEHVDMKTRSVLSTFHVFEILLRVAKGSSWSEAILETIPVRKGAKPKQQQPITSEAKNSKDVDLDKVVENDNNKVDS